MPIQLRTIYEIAVAEGRDVLCVVFGDLQLPPPHYDGMQKELGGAVIDQPPWKSHPTRQEVVSWLTKNGISYLETVLPMPGQTFEEGYRGALYLDVPFDSANPDYIKLTNFLENPDKTPRLPGMTFWALTFHHALRQVEQNTDKHDWPKGCLQ